MELASWLAFALAATVVLLIPGPTIIMVVSQSLSHGRRAAIPLVLGVVLGDFTAMTGSLLGLGAALATSALLFTVLKWLGAAYLIYLGIKTWRSKIHTEPLALTPSRQSASLMLSTYVVTALNPKSILFFVAFLPQFIDPRQAALPQFVLLGATFLVLAGTNAGLYAYFAHVCKRLLRQPGASQVVNRIGGGTLVGAGIFTAVSNA
ncbi:MAG: LysE family translocator [Gammaproteobacteria bacterium]|nr:LysE family translocator [Gammaproteobacteria bacterium]MCP5423821.1 LysE family translocator [Gammaproteobacteria bacterium]